MTSTKTKAILMSHIQQNEQVISSVSDYPGIVFSLPFSLFSWAQKILIKRQNWQSQIPLGLGEAWNTH